MNTQRHKKMRKRVYSKLLSLVINAEKLMEKQTFNRIKAVLAERRKSNNWLADELDMNRTTVSKWCRNDMQPRVETLFQIANVLDVDVRELLVSNKSKS
ncbi:MAG: helix-turn-helix transcriptional regulator [Prolixibacteraceae bacterium]